jgi:hypothetical protein
MLHIAYSDYEALRAHGEETYPNECCGVLLGKSDAEGNHVHQIVRAGNTRTDSAHNRYNIAPIELVKIQRQARGLSLDSGPPPTSQRPTGSAAPTSSPPSKRARPPSPTPSSSPAPPRKTRSFSISPSR